MTNTWSPEKKLLIQNRSKQSCRNCEDGYDGVCRNLRSDNHQKSTSSCGGWCELWSYKEPRPKLDYIDFIIANA